MDNQLVNLQSKIQSICIVGAGIQGLGILERIIAYAKKYYREYPLRIDIVDTSSEGPEQYNILQPDYLLLNIVCGQVSLFPDLVSVPGCPPTTGPSLYEWVCDRGLLLGDDGFSVGYIGRPIKPDDFLPRRLLGEYMAWFREIMKNQAPASLKIIEHKAKATDFYPFNNRFAVELSNGSSIDTDYLFLTVGQISEPKTKHLDNRSKKYIDTPYPLPEQLKFINPKDTIAITGLGLTAFDAILALTIGRGGKIVTSAGVDSYIPSGKEPRIVAFSRSGLPYRSRPNIGAPLKYESIVFTRSSIDTLLLKRGFKLDFDIDILPLLFTEMRIAYHRAKYGRDFGWTKAQKLIENLREAFVSGYLESYLSELDSYDPIVFEPKLIYFESFTNSHNIDSNTIAKTVTYEGWIRKWLEDDLKESQLGTNLSPLKAALETFREFRDIIRYAVEFGNLTNESSDRFFSIHSRTLNRIGVGPQKEHTTIILALIRAGILNVSLGPNPNVAWNETMNKWSLSSSSLPLQNDVFADWIYKGSTSRIHNIKDDASIVGAMAHKGFLRRLHQESTVIHAVDIDRNNHPISQIGVADKRIWVMGLLCEGVTFYNGYVTSPAKFVRSQYDADKAVAQIFS